VEIFNKFIGKAFFFHTLIISQKAFVILSIIPQRFNTNTVSIHFTFFR